MRAALLSVFCVTCIAATAQGAIFSLCPAPYRPLAERAQQADVIATANWVSADRKESPFAEKISFRIAEVLRSSGRTVKRGESVSLRAFAAGKRNQIFLLLGRVRGGGIEWDDPIPWNAARSRYLRYAPVPNADVRRQISFFAGQLDSKDPMLAEDAHHVMDNFLHRDLIVHAAVLPRKSLRKLVANPRTPRLRMRLFGKLLGLCGAPADAQLLESIMLRNPAADEVRLEIEGVMTGYLWLTGQAGLQRLEETKLLDGSEGLCERYSAMQAVMFLLDYGRGRIKPERLLQSLRHLLDDPDIGDLVVFALPRYKDWSVQNRLMKQFSDPRCESVNRRAIARYMMCCERDNTMARDGKPPLHVIRARAYLRRMEQLDPKAVAAAKRWFE